LFGVLHKVEKSNEEKSLTMSIGQAFRVG
jgi:hypothetical protein